MPDEMMHWANPAWQDWFVGIVSIAAGLFLTASAAANWEWYFQLPKPRRLSQWWGRPAARVFFVVLGVGFVVLGIAICLGFKLNQGA